MVSAVTAYAAGNSAVAGASGAAMGEYIAQHQISTTIEPLSEAMMILSESVSIALIQTQEVLERTEKTASKTSSLLNLSRNTIDKQIDDLEIKKRKIHKYSTELKNNTIKNQTKLIIKVASVVGVINMMVVILVGYLIMQKQLPQPQITLDSKNVATSIVERLRSKK
ncbi:hypothetical protein N5580_04115 [Pantoea piersonii]|uniref:Uncharacterized protein n=1 Tax=Pantoea piersonii TaxID=2364647 RepID=A0AAJ5UAP2_9GAMM|nr:hypothetical protein [Pantoea piersonii]WBG91747.1 hypothetical protein N5580_04115 [Pantoea piersonii]